MTSKWTSHCPGRGAPHGSNRWQTDNRQFYPDRYGAAAAGPGLCGCGYVPGSRPACFGRQSRDVPSLRRGGSPGVGAQAREGCRGTGYRVMPARGDISDLAGTEGGYALWGASRRSRIVCLASVRMWVHYPVLENARWLVRIYDHGLLRDSVGVRDFILRAGWYYWDFPVGGEFPATDSVCLTAQFGTGPHLRAVTSCALIG